MLLRDDEALEELRYDLNAALLGGLVLVGVVALDEGCECLAGQGLQEGSGDRREEEIHVLKEVYGAKNKNGEGSKDKGNKALLNLSGQNTNMIQ